MKQQKFLLVILWAERSSIVKLVQECRHLGVGVSPIEIADGRHLPFMKILDFVGEEDVDLFIERIGRTGVHYMLIETSSIYYAKTWNHIMEMFQQEQEPTAQSTHPHTEIAGVDMDRVENSPTGGFNNIKICDLSREELLMLKKPCLEDALQYCLEQELYERAALIRDVLSERAGK